MKKIEYTALPHHVRFHDDQLKILSRSFSDLPEMEYAGGPMGRESGLDILEKKQSKHIQTFPGAWAYGARFIFRQTRVYLAVCKPSRLDDLMRFADALTLLLWKYKERGSLIVCDKGFNFSLKDAEMDLELWRETRPDITELIMAIVGRLEELEIIQLPADRAAARCNNPHSFSRTRTVAGKVESILVRHSELIQLQLDEHTTKMDRDGETRLRQIREDVAWVRAEIAQGLVKIEKMISSPAPL